MDAIKRIKGVVPAQRLIILATLVILFVFFWIMKPSYASYENIMTIVLATCVNGILALGVTFVIITGGIDLSLGTVMTFSCIMSGTALTVWNFGMVPAILFGLASGTACGFCSGFGVTKMKLPPFISTMAIMMITKGLSLVISGIKPIYFTSAPLYREIALGSILGIEGFYNAILILIVMTVLAHLLLQKTILGRYCFAIGSNEEAARLSGVKVHNWKIAAYALCGFFAAVSGVVMSSRLNSAQPQLGSGYEMEAIAAAVIGGTSLSGGEGSVVGTIIGAFIMSVLTNGLRIMSVPSELQGVVIGLVLALAVYIDQSRRAKADTH